MSKEFYLLTLSEQKKWVASEIKKTEKRLDDLKKISRKLVLGRKVIVDERPDEMELKS